MARQLIRDFALNSSGTIAGRVVDLLLHYEPHAFVLLDASGQVIDSQLTTLGQ